MSFTLAQLKTAIQDYTENTEDTFESQLDTFIRLAEEKIIHAVRIQNFNTTTVPVVPGTIVADATSVQIADSYEAPLSPMYFKVRIGDGVVANAWTFLLLKDYNFLQEYAPINSATGRPKYYSFYNDESDSNKATFAFSPAADVIYNYEILYYFNPTSLVDVPAADILLGKTGRTWLSTHGANALLYGSLVEAYTFMKGEADIIQMYASQFVASVELLRSMEGDSYREEVYRSPGDSVSAPAPLAPQG